MFRYFKHAYFILLLSGLLVGVSTYSFAGSYSTSVPKMMEGVPQSVLSLALKAQRAGIQAGYIKKTNLVTLIDYSKPAYQKRLWVIDIVEQKVLFHTYVAHGRASGLHRPKAFSNEPGSHQSSLGVFVTGEPYQGRHGTSLYIHGLEPGINDKAYRRSVVMHGARYVSHSRAKAGFVGRSHGCPAVDEALAKPIIQCIQKGSLLFAYYPDENWLKTSQYLSF